MNQYVEIEFDCMPLRSIGRLDVPIDASPAFRRQCERVKNAMERHGTHNAYYLYNANCVFHVTNHSEIGRIEFKFEGTLLTDEADCKSSSCDLEVTLLREQCEWLTEPVVKWFAETVPQSVTVEFDRYIQAGDLKQTKERLKKIQAESDGSGGFLGMYL